MDPRQYKQKLLNSLYQPYQNCTACPLSSGRANVVFGEGNPDADMLFIGEAPGRHEDEQARPFVGRSGQLLTKTLQAIGIQRKEIFITNVVKCRPPNNRLPLPNESSICKKLLLFNQIKIIRPAVICCLGSHALSSLLNRTVKITKERGVPINYHGTTLIPTYHPAYILRNPKELKALICDLKLAHQMATKISRGNKQ